MADPLKEQIAANLVTALKGIRKGGGYHTDAGKFVSRRREGIDERDGSRLPALFLFTGTEDAPDQSQGTKCYTSRAEFVVTGYVEGGDDLDDLLVKLEADVKKAVLTDRGRGALALDTMLLGVTTDYAEFAPFGRGMIVASFDVEYQWSLTAL